MKSIDANIALRLLLRDHPAQEQAARDILTKPTLLLSTVILEIVWVLTGKGWSREEIARGLKGLFKLANLHIADREAVWWVVDRFEVAGDFSDMLHVALSRGATAFVTFDQKIWRYCSGGPVPIETIKVD